MDTSEKYILMCEKAEEIQDQWNPKDGDFFAAFFKSDPSHFDLLEIVYNADDGYYSSGPFDKEKYNYIWLPRQDQLQEMIKDPWKLIFEFEKFIAFGLAEEGYYGETSEQAMLKLLMCETYNKEWDGDKGAWV